MSYICIYCKRECEGPTHRKVCPRKRCQKKQQKKQRKWEKASRKKRTIYLRKIGSICKQCGRARPINHWGLCPECWRAKGDVMETYRITPSPRETHVLD